jgi:hypothetical protein
LQQILQTKIQIAAAMVYLLNIGVNVSLAMPYAIAWGMPILYSTSAFKQGNKQFFSFFLSFTETVWYISIRNE